MPRYKEALIEEIGAFSPLCRDRKVDTIYFGGGTPSIFEISCFRQVFNALRASFQVEDGAEITIEANPATVSAQTLRAYRETGINRISFGVQSANDELLKKIGRLHSYAEACASVRLAASEGFENISADLIYGLPGQTLQDFLDDIEKVAELPVAHISAYGLKIEENTPFGRDQTLILPNEDEVCEMYLQGVESLKDKGFIQYEISNFAKPGYESRHNLKYWRREEYLGFGPAAHSFFDGMRFAVKPDLDAFLAEKDFSLDSEIYTEKRYIDGREAYEERVMLGLRTRDGIPLDVLYDAASDKTRLKSYLDLLYGSRYAEEGAVLRLTPKGMLISNSIISDLLTI